MRRLLHTTWLIPALVALIPASAVVVGQQRPTDVRKLQQEEAGRYYRKWLDEDVVYIITPEETEIFESLANDDERDQFIEQFWRTRDPDPMTSENEFKEEHYRRIAYVNERYFGGIPGWKSDRGQIYIRYGPPDQTEKYPAGGPYRRRASEGGGEANTFAFERWWYAHIDGVGENIEIEFVDKSGTNEYRIALNPNDKESFIQIDGSAMTQDEFDGTVSRADRLYHHAMGVDRNNLNVLEQDLPFQRLLRYARLQQAPRIQNTHLQELVDSSIRYDELPFAYKADWIRIGPRALVPLTIGVRQQDLQFGADGMGLQAGLDVFGRVKALNGEIVAVFEDSIVKDRATGEAPGQSKALYQKLLVLDPGRYLVDMVIEDIHSGRIGISREALTIPTIRQDELASSPVILVEKATPLAAGEEPGMFVLGAHRIYPRLGPSIPPLKYVTFYLELYNVGIDAASLTPDLDLTYQLVDAGEVVDEKKDPGGRRASFTSSQRVVLLEYLNLSRSRSAQAVIRIIAEDRVTGRSLTVEQPIRIDRTVGQ